MLALAFISAALAGQDVTLKTSDGQSLHATIEKSAGSKKGVVLVHMEGRSSEDWQYVGEHFARSGLATIAPDLRGHGKNGVRDLSDADYKAMTADVAAAIGWLRQQGAEQVSCVGASLGANLCLQAAATDPGVVNVVMLSPGLNIKGVTSNDALPGYADRPLLLISSQQDIAGVRSAELLEKSAQGQKHLEVVGAEGKGTRLLTQNAGLEGLIQSWLLGTYQLKSGEIVMPKPPGIDPGTVETTGKKLPGHQ